MLPLRTCGICLLCLLAWTPVQASDEVTIPTLTMCDLARDPEKYSGMMVRLKAQFAAGLHGSAFFDNACPTVVLGGYRWSNGACPVDPDGPDANADTEALTWAREFYSRRVAIGRMPGMEIVVVGRLIKPASFSKTVVLKGLAYGAGYCHMGASPFKLIVQRVEFVSFQETSDSRKTAPRK